MGITCHISLDEGKSVFQPGSIVSGAIKYFLDTEYEFTSITVSLKGFGKLYVEDLSEKRRDRSYKYSNDEVYVDIDNILQCKEEKLPIGQYETKFCFQLPHNIPGSLDYKKDTFDYEAQCLIQYYVRIKFARPGHFKFNIHFKKIIDVVSGQIPRMTTLPLVYGDQKKILQLSTLFSRKKGFVDLKATITNSVRRPGERVKIDCEVTNNTNVAIKEVKINLLEVDRLTLNRGHEIRIHSAVDNAEYRHEAIPMSESANFTAEISVPELCASIDHSQLIGRDYAVFTEVILPMPHMNMVLEIPFQVVNDPSSNFEKNNASTSTVEYPSDDPPSYWEVMGEDNDDEDKKARIF